MRTAIFLLLAAFGAVSCSTARRAPLRPVGPPAVTRPTPQPPAVVRIVSGGAERLLVSKETMRLAVVGAEGDTLALWPIACGEGLGDKVREGDRRTPEGCFVVQEILDTSRWPRPAVAGEDPAWRSPYGPYFIRLLAPPHEGIGIHGTDDETSIGLRVSAGCIRLRNDDLRALLRHVRIGMAVVVLSSAADRAADAAAAEAATALVSAASVSAASSGSASAVPASAAFVSVTPASAAPDSSESARYPLP